MDRQMEFDFVRQFRQESARVLSSLEENDLRKVIDLMARIVIMVWEHTRVEIQKENHDV